MTLLVNKKILENDSLPPRFIQFRCSIFHNYNTAYYESYLTIVTSNSLTGNPLPGTAMTNSAIKVTVPPIPT
jgi:hypothetical protein